MIQVMDKHNCCGCSACAQICSKHCIEMVEDQEGFLYPRVNGSLCVNCGVCEKVCPFSEPGQENTPLKVYAAINKDEEVRRVSSSGGMFTLLASQTILERGVVFGVKFGEDWRVAIDSTETIEGLEQFRGSKYIQATVGDAYRRCEQLLKDGRQVLFSGMPCQIAGLKKYLRREYANLMTCDLICHGVPSPKVWEKYLYSVRTRHAGNTVVRRFLEKVPFCSSLNLLPFIYGIRFRDKSDGWKKYRFVLELAKAPAEDKGSTVLSSVEAVNEPFGENVYMKAFLQNLSLRPSCYHCKCKCGRSHSDITLADFWGIQEVMPEMDDDKGTSLVMANTEKGLSMLMASGVMMREIGMKDALRDNSMWSECVVPHPKRDLFFARLDCCKDVQNVMNGILQPKMSVVTIVKRIMRKTRTIIKETLQ